MSEQLNDVDHKAISEFLGLLVNLDMSPTDAFKAVDKILQPLGWSFVFFNDIEDFWVTSNEMK